MKSILCVSTLAGVAAVASAGNTQLVTIDIAGAVNDGFGSFVNNIVFFDLNQIAGAPLGGEVTIDAIEYELTVETIGFSWLSESSIFFTDFNELNDPNAFALSPGLGSDMPGLETFSSGGLLEFSGLGLDPLTLDQGTIYLEYFETFDDVPFAQDSTITGTVTFRGSFVPAPGAAAMLGFAGLVGARRRR